MFYGWQIFLGVLVVLVFIVLPWLRRLGILKPRMPSYESLQEQKNKLHDCVLHWQYPDGSFVPQHKRQQMFKELHKLSYRLRKHPDNPDNVRQRTESSGQP